MILYYLIISFGILLLLYAFKSIFTLRKKVIGNDKTSFRISEILNTIKSNISLWKYYFIAGNSKNLFRNIILTLCVFLVLFTINNLYLQVNKTIFLISVILLFILIIWKIGQHRNRKIFEAYFPEVIQILNSSTSSGAGLLQALERCGKDISGQLGKEFKSIYKRLSLGEDPVSVFNDSYVRYPYKEFYFFITIIKINLDKGGQMREVINRLGRMIADSKKMEKKKKAMTSEARISAIIVSLFPVVFFIFMKFMMPENFDFIINDDNGRYILYYVLGSELLGMLIIWWLMRKTT
ncbi:tight adherence protein B [Volucribacter psittacicida]|uniref:Tight adherence protein B n=1 Tax=Volucribacter psittacicida TaxID=203482 RepID=A0A4R1FRB5_9PAST|nr:type II secretion system F family protein [Volucribacter psittacicida]TCJ97826.1 tight adherence protein B [Volucribacter psittacicida]